jgi:Flp pilus assembly protein TadG
MVRLLEHSNEQGQASVETALVLPIFLFIMFTVMQFCWIVYCDVTLSSATSHMEYSVSSSDVASYQDQNALVKDKIETDFPILKTGTLTVEETSIQISDQPKQTEQLSSSDFTEYGLATKNQEVTLASVNCKIKYTPINIFGQLGGNITLVRNVDSSKLIQKTFEVG